MSVILTVVRTFIHNMSISFTADDSIAGDAGLDMFHHHGPRQHIDVPSIYPRLSSFGPGSVPMRSKAATPSNKGNRGALYSEEAVSQPAVQPAASSSTPKKVLFLLVLCEYLCAQWTAPVPDKCTACNLTVYLAEGVSYEGQVCDCRQYVCLGWH